MKTKQFAYGESTYLLSLSKLAEKKIIDVAGYPSDPFGGTPVFQVSVIIFEDGTTLDVEGEHDCPYLPPNDGVGHLNEKTLQSIIDEDEKG